MNSVKNQAESYFFIIKRNSKRIDKGCCFVLLQTTLRYPVPVSQTGTLCFFKIK
jgi:hypothetical protein